MVVGVAGEGAETFEGVRFGVRNGSGQGVWCSPCRVGRTGRGLQIGVPTMSSPRHSDKRAALRGPVR